MEAIQPGSANGLNHKKVSKSASLISRIEPDPPVTSSLPPTISGRTNSITVNSPSPTSAVAPPTISPPPSTTPNLPPPTLPRPVIKPHPELESLTDGPAEYLDPNQLNMPPGHKPPTDYLIPIQLNMPSPTTIATTSNSNGK